jgi:hypothetical protein
MDYQDARVVGEEMNFSVSSFELKETCAMAFA